MHIDEKYMWRCLQLSKKGARAVKQNPLVGCVIVCDNKIIGEGYHRKIGEAHAEVNAINSVKDKALLEKSTLYVSLEPCSHFGKTPPCAELIIQHKIPKVVIATPDPNPKVSGKGIEILKEAGIYVQVGVLEEEAKKTNCSFFVNQIIKRPFIILKWAQTSDGFIDYNRESNIQLPLKLSNTITQAVVHKMRSENIAIMVGTNTAIKDNPSLTTRKWYGDNPVRVVIDKKGKLSPNSNLFNSAAPTIVFTQIFPYPIIGVHIKSFTLNKGEEEVKQIINKLYELGVTSIIIEGGAILLDSFIKSGYWDEAFIEISTTKKINEGVKAPQLAGCYTTAKNFIDSHHIHIKNEIT